MPVVPVTLQSRLTAAFQAIGADIKSLNGKALSAVDMSAIITSVTPGQPIGAAAWTILKLPGALGSGITITQSDGANPDFVVNADGSLTFQKAGIFTVLGAVGAMSAMAANSSVIVDVNRKNGATPGIGEGTITRGLDTFGTNTNANNVVPVAVTKQFAVGDRIAFYIYSSAAYTYQFWSFSVVREGAGPAGPVGPQGIQGIPGSSVQVPMDPWHTVGANGEPPFANVGFSNIAGNQVLQFRKSPLGRVALRGYINTPAVGGSPFQLGATYRPPGTVRFEANGQNAAGTQVPVLVYVLSDGTVNVHGTNAPIAVDMSVVEFDTDTVTQFAVGPQGPKGDPGGFTGLLQDTDGINLTPYTFRSRLAFLGPNVKLTDGGAAGPLGSGDYIGISNEPTKGSGPLPNVNVRDGTAYDLVVAPDLVWRLRYTNGRWLMIGGAPLVYQMSGENNAYVGISSGNLVCVNASSKILQWTYTPPVDVWVEAEFFISLVLKVDALYHYIQFTAQCSPTPPVQVNTETVTRTQHNSVQQYEPYFIKARWGLAAGVAYTMNCICNISGGAWNYYQGANHVQLLGKAWPR